MKDNPQIVITVGDEAGVGPEIILKALASKEIPSSDDIAVIELAFAVIRPSLRSCHVLPFQRYILFWSPVSIQISPIDVAVGVVLWAKVCSPVGARGTQALPLHL